jgi:hypothetical protein
MFLSRADIWRTAAKQYVEARETRAVSHAHEARPRVGPYPTPIKYQTTLMFRANTGHTVAIFRQINKDAPHIHHDSLEFPDGEIVLLTRLCEGQKATVLTLPTQPKTAAEEDAQRRVAHVG